MKTILLTVIIFFAFIGANGAIKTWDGGGGNGNLSVAANWVGDIAPISGDDLVFPSALITNGLNNTYNNATVFRSITMNGGFYSFSGNNFNISNSVNINTGFVVFGNSVVLTNSTQTFTVEGPASVTYSQVLIGTNSLTIGGDGSSQITNITGSGKLIKEGFGDLTLSEGIGFTGTYEANGRNFNVNANTPNSDVVINNGEFGGAGTVGNVINRFGVIIPGNASNTSAVLNTKNLTLESASYYFNLSNSFGLGVNGYSQLNVTGTVTLNNPSLIVSFFFFNRPALNVATPIIINDGTDAVSGIFQNFPEGTRFYQNGSSHRISYVGGTGNDVTLTRLNIAPFDFDGDGKTDISTYRPASGTWSIKQSSNNATITQNFGLSTDILTPADYDGDFKTDISVFRPSNGVWYMLNSSNNSFSAAQFGTNGDISVPNDYTGDGISDIAVYRQGVWYIYDKIQNTYKVQQFGLSADKPVPREYNGSGKSELSVFRPATNIWYSYDDRLFGNPVTIAQFGIANDVPIPADFDGDGKIDYAVFRASDVSGQPDFYIFQSSTRTLRGVEWGSVGDIPQTGDFDGDGKADVAVFRPSNNTWYLLQSTSGFSSTVFGQSGDKPVSSAYIN